MDSDSRLLPCTLAPGPPAEELKGPGRLGSARFMSPFSWSHAARPNPLQTEAGSPVALCGGVRW